MWPFQREMPVRASIRPDELEAALLHGSGALHVIDVRSAAEYATGHIPGARHIQHTTIRQFRPHDFDDRPCRLVVTCAYGGRARVAAVALRELGYRDVVLLEGHMSRWCAEGRPLARGPDR